MEGICALGGLRAQPSREDLRMFVENVASLNGAQVAELLQAKMVISAEVLTACMTSCESLTTLCCTVEAVIAVLAKCLLDSS